MVIVPLTLVFSAVFIVFIALYYSLINKLGTQSVVLSLSVTINCLTMKGIRAGARETRVNPYGFPQGRAF